MAKWVHVRATLPRGVRGFWRRWTEEAGMVCTDSGLPAEEADETWIELRTAAERSEVLPAQDE
jgi:hypothetical protein